MLIRPYGKDGIVLHQLYYATEVRAFDEIDTGATFKFSDKEHDLAEKLIEQLSSDSFEPEKYSDSYSERVEAAVQQKVEGKEITVAPEAPQGSDHRSVRSAEEELVRHRRRWRGRPKGPAPAAQKTAPKADKGEAKKKSQKG